MDWKCVGRYYVKGQRMCLTFFGSRVFCIKAQSTRATATQPGQRYMLRFLLLKEKQEICIEK